MFIVINGTYRRLDKWRIWCRRLPNFRVAIVSFGKRFEVFRNQVERSHYEARLGPDSVGLSWTERYHGNNLLYKSGLSSPRKSFDCQKDRFAVLVTNSSTHAPLPAFGAICAWDKPLGEPSADSSHILFEKKVQSL